MVVISLVNNVYLLLKKICVLGVHHLENHLLIKQSLHVNVKEDTMNLIWKNAQIVEIILIHHPHIIVIVNVVIKLFNGMKIVMMVIKILKMVVICVYYQILIVLILCVLNVKWEYVLNVLMAILLIKIVNVKNVINPVKLVLLDMIIVLHVYYMMKIIKNVLCVKLIKDIKYWIINVFLYVEMDSK